jgi:multiple sugar transport system permease protein
VKTRQKKLKSYNTLAAFFHTPTFLVLSFITLAPIIYTIYISFFNFKLSVPGGKEDFIGLQNYVELFTDTAAFESMFTTFKFMLIAVTLQIVLGFAIALGINAVPKFKRLLTSLVLIPMMVAPLVVGLMFSFFMNPQFGLYPYLIEVLYLPLPTSPLTDPKTALAVIALTDVWEWTPYLALMFLAGLQSIPGESYEAAQIDGANKWQTFTKVTIPLMMPVVVVGVILRSMEAFKEFDKPYILTGGGPGAATEVIDMFAYRQAFISFNFSYAAAVCVVLFVILLTSGMLYGKLVLERK